MTIERAILEKVRSLAPERRQAILDFAEFLVQTSQAPTKRQWSSAFLSTFGAWEGELERAPQALDERGCPVGFFERTYGICAGDPIVIDGGIAEALDDGMEGGVISDKNIRGNQANFV